MPHLDPLEWIVGIYSLILCPPTFYWWIQGEREKTKKFEERNAK